jgi:Flp pilus assembly protein TadG
MTRRRRDRGAAAVELAILLPMLVAVFGGIVDLGNVLRVRVQLQEAVQDGASYAAQNPGSPTSTKARVNGASSDVTLTSVTVTCGGTSPGYVTVRATLSHKWLMGLFSATPLTMTADATADVISTTTCVSG